MMNRLSFALLSVVFLAACASIPQQISNAPVNSPTVATVRATGERFKGTRVRWGGTIANVENRKSQTLMEIVSRALNDIARPIDSDQSQGRFLARFEGFLDPAIYSKGRDITVVGTVDGQQTRPIDEYQYRYPVVNVESYYLWQQLPENRYARTPYFSPYYYDPFFYDPFYDPFFGPSPYFYW
ncbi:MAG: Slp family lipoprotein [Pseudomonadota bacterium]|nr:Slp family lipoprotein [Pseudomonadota bacterium]